MQHQQTDETQHPFEKIRTRWLATDSMAGVGIDPDINKIPDEIWQAVGGKSNIADGFTLFGKTIIDATAQDAVDFKVNSSFFKGSQGREALYNIFNYLKQKYPKVLRVCDGKFADIDNTAEKIAEEIFGDLDADAVLLNPYLGFDAIKPFIQWKNKIVIMCVRTSNPSAAQVQDMLAYDGRPIWQHILDKSLHGWNPNNNIIPVLSATSLHGLSDIREQINDVPILLAGVGAQGGSLDKSVPHLLDSNGYGLMISSSRGIIYADRGENESIGQAAHRELLKLKDAINQAKRSK